jgi:hypothetical protein
MTYMASENQVERLKRSRSFGLGGHGRLCFTDKVSGSKVFRNVQKWCLIQLASFLPILRLSWLRIGMVPSFLLKIDTAL